MENIPLMSQVSSAKTTTQKVANGVFTVFKIAVVILGIFGILASVFVWALFHNATV